MLAKASVYFWDVLKEPLPDAADSVAEFATPARGSVSGPSTALVAGSSDAALLHKLAFHLNPACDALSLKLPALAHCVLVYEAGGVRYPIHADDPWQEGTGRVVGYICPPDPSDALAFTSTADDVDQHQPALQFEPPRGLRQFPPIFAWPPDKAAPVAEHWPTLVSLLMSDPMDDQDDDLRTRHLIDTHRGVASAGAPTPSSTWTYFVRQVEPRVLLVVLCRDARKATDPVVVEFLCQQTDRLRLATVFRGLRALAS